LEKVGFANGILGVARVELHDVLEGKIRGHINGHGDLRHEEIDSLRARRGRPRAHVVIQWGRLNVLEDLPEVQRSSVRNGPWFYGLSEILGYCLQ
jgi:hypothetical protein